MLGCAWPPFSLMRRPWEARFARFWPECPWPVTWAECPDPAEPWGAHAARAARACEEPVLCVWMCDFILTEPVAHAEVMRCRAEMHERWADYYRLQPTPPCTIEFAHGLAGIHDPVEPYRASLHVALWGRDYFARQAEGCRDPWEFETTRPIWQDPGLHLSVSRSNRPISHVEFLKRRSWTPDGLRICAEEGWPTA